MSKPLNENLTSIRFETEDGDLLPIMDVAGTKFNELINAVASHQKAGTLTLKITVKPSTAGAMAVKADVSITKPKPNLCSGRRRKATSWPKTRARPSSTSRPSRPSWCAS